VPDDKISRILSVPISPGESEEVSGKTSGEIRGCVEG